MRLLTCGRRAVLVEVDDQQQVLALHQSLRRDPPTGVVELVPAARTVLVRFDPRLTGRDGLEADLAHRSLGAPEPTDRPAVEVEVRYDGPDLADVAELVGLTEREVVDRHTAGRYVVAFIGFAPGFAYLVGGDPALQVPRRARPRASVPAGSVALAGDFTGIYPGEGPGGWQLVGRTDIRLWDVDRAPPALLGPGDQVVFREVRP